MTGPLSEDASCLAFEADATSFLTSGNFEEPEYSSTNWYFSRDEIEKNSPSRKDGVDLKKEAYFRKSYCTFLQDLGMRLKVPQVTIATAIVMCHRFFLRQSHARNDRFMVGTVCMFLAGKVEETPRPLRDVVILSYELRNKKDPVAAQRIRQKKDVYEDQKELLLLGESLVLTTLEFDMNIHHPYKPLVTAIKRFKVAQIALAQVAWNFVNDGLRTSLCLQFKPHHIAAGAIFLATKFLKVELPFIGEKVWWHEFDVTPRQLEDVSNQMLELYEQNKAAPSFRPSDISLNAGVCNGYKTEILNGEQTQFSVPITGVSQSSQVSSFNMAHDQVLTDSANVASSVPRPQVDFISRDSCKERLHGGQKQRGYAVVCEGCANAERIPNSQKVYYNHNKADINTMSGLQKQTVGQEFSGVTAIHCEESPNGRNNMHVLPKAAATQKVNYERPESQGDLIARQGINGHRKPSEQKHQLADQLKGGAKEISEIMKIRKEDEGKRRPLVNLQEVEIDSVKMSSEEKRKPKIGGSENLFGVNRKAAIMTGLVSRELENAVEATGKDMFKSDLRENRSHQSRDNTSSLEFSNDHEAKLWNSAKHKKFINSSQPYYNKKEKRDHERGNLQTTKMQMVKSCQGTAYQVEEGELHLQKQNHFSKVSNEEHAAPDTFGQVPSLQPSTREWEGSYEKKHWHGDSQTKLISGHHQQVQKSDQGIINQHRHKGQQVWQERDAKKVCRDHLK